jgi:hypothetical protein
MPTTFILVVAMPTTMTKTTTIIIARRHTMPRHGHKIMTITMPRCTPQDGIACKPSQLGPPSGSRPFGQENLLLCIRPGPKLYIRAARAPILAIQLSFIHSYTVEGLLKLPFGQPSPSSSSSAYSTILAPPL